MSEWWGFTYTKHEEVLRWLWVCKRSPFVPFLFCKQLVRYIAEHYVKYVISLDMNGVFSLDKNKGINLLHVVEEQRDVIAMWLQQKATEKLFLQRHGKTTIITELVNQIPLTLSVFIVLSSIRSIHLMKHRITRSNVQWMTYEEYANMQRKDCDFLFAEDVPLIPYSLCRIKYLFLYSSKWAEDAC